jgi:hypothetical protein
MSLLLTILCTSVGAVLAYGSGLGLVTDAYSASRGGHDWFFDTASRVAIPFAELGTIMGLVVATAARSRQPRRVIRVAGASLSVAFLINLIMFFVDHPLAFIGL